MILYLAALLGAALAVAHAAEITGTVLDARGGEPLARVRVQLTGADREAVTGPDGRFRFEAVEAGKYSLHVETVGYRLLQREVEVGAGDLTLEIVLSPDTFRRTDSVEVRADVFEPVAAASPSQQTLSSTEVKNLGTVLMDDPIRAVHSLPGVVSNDDFYAQFSVRGAPYEKVGFYLDDVLLHAPFHTVQGISDGGSVSIFNTDMLDTLALLPSAFPSRYADRAGAALDVRTRDGNRTGASLRGSVTMTSASGLGEGPLGGRASWIASVRRSYVESLAKRLSDDPSLAIGFFDYHGKLSVDLTPRQTLHLHLIDGATRVDRTERRNQYGVNTLIEADYHATTAKAGWKWSRSESLLASVTGAWLRERYDNRNKDARPLGAGLYGEWVGNASVSWYWKARQPLEAGWSTRRVRDDGFRQQYQTTSAVIRLRDTFGGRALRHGGYLEQQWEFGPLRANTGLRWDRHTLARADSVSPHASLVLRVRQRTELHLGWGHYVQYPELSILTAPAGGRHILPERAHHAVAAIEQRIGGQTRLRLEAFHRAGRDGIARPLLDPRLVSGNRVVLPRDTRYYNSVRGYARGLQLVLQRRSANRLSGWLGYTLQWTRQRDGIELASFPSLDDQRHTANLFLNYRLTPSLNLSGRYAYGSGLPVPGYIQILGPGRYSVTNVRNRASLGDYQRLDFRANKSFSYDKWKFTLYGELLNATNHTNRRVNSFDGVDTRTGQVFLSVVRVFPILPSAGLMIEF